MGLFRIYLIKDFTKSIRVKIYNLLTNLIGKIHHFQFSSVESDCDSHAYEHVVMCYLQYVFAITPFYFYLYIPKWSWMVNFLIWKAIWRSSSFIHWFSIILHRLILQVFKRRERMHMNANSNDHLFDWFIIWNLDQPTRLGMPFPNMLFYLYLKKYIEKSHAQLHIHYSNVVVNITWNHITSKYIYSKRNKRKCG